MKKIIPGLRRAAATAVIGTMVSVGSIAVAPTASAHSGEVTATTAVNIRTGASINSSRIGVLYRGQSVTAIDSSNGWTKVSRGGRTAYIASAYLSGSKPATAAKSSSRAVSSTGGNLNRGGSSGLNQTNPNTKKIIGHIWATQPAIKTMFGKRNSSTPDHPAGRAVDVMIPNYRTNKALGWRIAEYYRANARQFGINYIIFDQKIWSVGRNAQGWRAMSGRGSDAANHKDHVHINTYG